MVRLEKLNKEEVRSIYNDHMVIDFPKDELKPLSTIYKAMDEDKYECFGLTDEGEMAGYMFFIRIDNDYLIDYIATFPERRNQGLGSKLLAILKDQLSSADSIIGEVEDPQYAETEEDRILQTRRYGFYLRNGCIDTGVKASAFGVPFILLEIVTKRKHTHEEIRELYRKLYRGVLPAFLYEANIDV